MDEKHRDIEQSEGKGTPSTTILSDEPDRVTWKVWGVVAILSLGYGISFM